MPRRKLLLLAVALLIAGATVLVARANMTPTPALDAAAAPAPQATTEILVAARDLPTGTLVKEADLKWQPWPADAATENFVIKGKTQRADEIGAVVRQGLKTGDPILFSRLIHAHDQGFMAAVLNAGLRAVSVSITPVGGVAGFVFPGDHVDVIVAHQVNRKTPNPTATKSPKPS